MTSSSKSKAALAGRAWQLMLDYLIATSPVRTRSLQRRGLTPNDSRALWSLDEKEGRPIGTLARDWVCDPANATFIIDRLERAGLARRREDANDRRVKLVTLTSRGRAMKQELLDEFRTPPPNFMELPGADLESLVKILSKLHVVSDTSREHAYGAP